MADHPSDMVVILFIPVSQLISVDTNQQALGPLASNISAGVALAPSPTNAVPIVAPENPDRAATQFLRRGIFDMMRIKRQAEKYQPLITPRRYYAKLGDVSPKASHSILKGKVSHTDFDQQIFNQDPFIFQDDILSLMPNEIQIMIWNNLDTDADRICLALTSKTHAEMFHKYKPRLTPIRHGVTKKIHKLNVLLRLQEWSGLTNYNLCFGCVNFKAGNKKGWGGDSELLTYSYLFGREVVKGPHCRFCIERNYFETMKGKPLYKQFRSLAKQLR